MTPERDAVSGRDPGAPSAPAAPATSKTPRRWRSAATAWREGRKAKLDRSGAEESGRTVFTTDAPTDLDKYDAFGHRAYADAIADILYEARSPFTLGVFGDWGLGKTSIIDEVGRQLVNREVAFASFDVWRYEGDALRREFLRDVATQLQEQRVLHWRYKPAKKLRDLEVDVTETRQSFRISMAGLVVASVQGLLVGLLFYLFLRSSYPHRILGAKPPHGSPADLAAVVVGGVGLALAVLNQVVRLDPSVVTLKRIEEPERFLGKFQELMGAIKADRLVVAIDNLDRCSPRVVDELLATIKTYLEPDPARCKDKSALPPVVFMIAADDNAIRRHMLSRELEAQGFATQPTLETDSGDPPGVENGWRREAEIYVDEYLRKFFTATIRLRDMLSEDIQSYARKQLEPFVEARGPKETSAREVFESRLASLVASALRTNPRRIKQFVNSLETKLRVIQARERTRQIIPKISDDVLGIAKVTIIEEEWPQRYRELEDDWRMMHLWQERLGTFEFPDHDFGAFLRTTRDIEPRDVPAIVNLKQSLREQTVPEWNRFREAITLGQFEEAQKLVEAASEEQRTQYTSPLRAMLSEEARSKRDAEALNVLEAALTIPDLMPAPDARLAMLSYALDHADLRRRLSRVDPHAVFALWPRLNSTQQDALSEQFIDLGRLSPTAARAAAEELAPILNRLPEPQARQLENQLASEPWATSNPEIYLPLVRVRPTLVHDSTVDSVFQTWVNNGGPRKSDALEVAMRAMGAGRAEQRIPDLYNEIVRQLQTAASDEQAVRQVLRLLGHALELVPRIDEPTTRALLSALQVALARTLPSGRDRIPRRIFALAGIIASTAGGKAAPDAFAPLAATFASERAAVVRDCAQRAAVGGPLRAALLDALSIYVAPQFGEERMWAAASALVTLDPEGGAERVVAQLAQLISQNNSDGVARLAISLAPKLGNRTGQVTAALEAHLPRAAAHARTTLLRDVSILWSVMDDEQQARFADHLARMLLSLDPTEAGVALNYIREAFDESPFPQQALTRAAGILPSTSWNPAYTQALALIVDHWDWLDDTARGAVVHAVFGWMRGQPHAANLILSHFAAVDGKAHERTELVRAALETEHLIPIADGRADLLATAWRLRGSDDRRAAKLLITRIEQLRASVIPMEQETLRHLASRIELPA